MCRTYNEAKRYYFAVVDFLKTRLKLDINAEKSNVINLKSNSSNFLGFKIKVLPKGKTKFGYVAKTDMSKKSVKKTGINLKNKVIKIQHSDKNKIVKTINDYNSTVLGVHNYYRYATNIYRNMRKINYNILKNINCRLKKRINIIKFKDTPREFQIKVKGIQNNSKIYRIMDRPLLPVSGVNHKNPMNFKQNTCNFTIEGRKILHKNLNDFIKIGLSYLNLNVSTKYSTEFKDNILSKYSAQKGKCHILGNDINYGKIYGYRKIPLDLGGTDSYNNLVIIDSDILKLLEIKEVIKINEFIPILKINKKNLEKINKLRLLANREEIKYKFT
jgi:hypothetical protein